METSQLTSICRSSNCISITQPARFCSFHCPSTRFHRRLMSVSNPMTCFHGQPEILEAQPDDFNHCESRLHLSCVVTSYTCINSLVSAPHTYQCICSTAKWSLSHSQPWVSWGTKHDIPHLYHPDPHLSSNTTCN